MSKGFLKITLAILLIATLIHIPKLAVAQNEIPRFICMSYSDKSKILLSWEKVAYADSYEVLKNNKKIFEATDKTTELIDGNTSPGMNYNYQIVAKKGEEILALSLRTSAFIEEKEENKSLSLEFKLDDYMYKINGQMEGPMDTPPIIKNGRSFLVIRYITEAVGAELSWDGTDKKVSIETNDKTIDLWIGKPVAKINGEEIQIDSEDDQIVPFISEGRTLLPLRFVSDNLDASDVIWNGDERSITLLWNYSQKIIQPRILLTKQTGESNIYKDSLGNNYKLNNMNEEPSSEVIALSSYEIDRYTVENSCVELSTEEFVVIEKADAQIGKILSNSFNGETGKLSVETDGKNIELSYDKTFDNLSRASDDSWIKLISSDDSITYWEYLTNTAHGGTEQLEIEFLNVGLNPEEMSLSLEGETILSGERTDVHFIWDSWDYDKLKPNTCGKITYTKNWLGRNIVLSFERNICPCEFELTGSSKKEILLRGEDNNDVEFMAKNNSFVAKEFEVFWQCENDFPGTIKPLVDTIKLYPGEEGKCGIYIKSEKSGDGLFEIFYGVRCGDVEKTESVAVELIPNPNDYDAYIKEEFVIPRNQKEVEFTAIVENNSEKAVRLETKAIETEKCRITFERKAILVEGNSKEEFTGLVIFSDQYDRTPGTQFLINIEVEDSFTVKRFPLKINFDVAKIPIVDIEATYDEKKKEITVNGNVDWNGLPEGKIEIRNSNPGKTFANVELPYTFKAEDTTATTITVTAYSGGGENEGVGYALVTNDKFNKEFRKYGIKEPYIIKRGKNVTLDIDTSFNIGNCQMTLSVLWGDGTESRETFSEEGDHVNVKMEHNYGTPINEKDGENYVIHIRLYSSPKGMSEVFLTDVHKVKVEF